MKWVPETKIAHKLWSVRLDALKIVWGAVIVGWNMAPAAWRPDVPGWGKWVFLGAGMFCCAAGPFARLLIQPGLVAPPADPKP